MSGFFSFFLAPALFSLLALIPLVVLMYLLKLKRRSVVISSSLLWVRSIQDLSANAPFQKLRRNLLLLLQILILLLLTFALVRPFLQMSGPLAGRLILLIDNSASMQATDVAPSRMAKAKEEALKIVGNARRSDLIMVITFADKPRVLAPMTSNKDELRRVIESIEPVDTDTDFGSAIQLALNLVVSQEDAKVQIISDGALPDLPDISIGEQKEGEEPVVGLIGDSVRLLTVGESSRNVGITELDVREAPGRPMEKQIFARIENTGDAPASAIIGLYEGDLLLDAKSVEMEPGARAGALFSNLDLRSGQAEIRVDYREDVFPLDNRAHLVVSQRRKSRVLLVTGGNPYLETVLAHLDIVEASRVSPQNYQSAAGYDLVIFDGGNVESIGRGSYLFWNSVPPVAGVTDHGDLEFPATTLLDWHRTHPVNRFIRLEGFRVERAIHLEWPPEAQILLEAREGPLITALEKDDRRIVCVAFDIYNTNWAQRSVSFPIFISNAVRWLVGVESEERRSLFRTGEPIPLVTEKAVAQFEVRTPDGRTETLRAEAGRPAYFAATHRAGYYRIRELNVPENQPDASRIVAVNLLSSAESDLSPRESLRVGFDPIDAQRREIKRDLELWPYLALAAFAILMVEWFIYSRRVWI